MDRNQIATEVVLGLRSIGLPAEAMLKRKVTGGSDSLEAIAYRNEIQMGVPEDVESGEAGTTVNQDVTYTYVENHDVTIQGLIRHNAESIVAFAEDMAHKYGKAKALDIVTLILFKYAHGWAAERALDDDLEGFTKGGRNQDKGGIDGFMNGRTVQIKHYTFRWHDRLDHDHDVIHYAFDDQGGIHVSEDRLEARNAAMDVAGISKVANYEGVNYL